jgi:very-short-patch-repair endonuclease
MKIKKINGQSVNLKIKNFLADKKERSKSKFQHTTKERLMQEYPHDLIYEEVRIPDENLILDFFIPSVKLVVECHGRQHTEHVTFFHRTKRDFHQQQIRDEKKRLWCKINGFRLVEVFDDSDRKT